MGSVMLAGFTYKRAFPSARRAPVSAEGEQAPLVATGAAKEANAPRAEPHGYSAV
jgi:hypothetical protein